MLSLKDVKGAQSMELAPPGDKRARRMASRATFQAGVLVHLSVLESESKAVARGGRTFQPAKGAVENQRLQLASRTLKQITGQWQ